MNIYFLNFVYFFKQQMFWCLLLLVNKSIKRIQHMI